MSDRQLLPQHEQLRILNEIAHRLNREVALSEALQATLQYTVELLGLRTGWIWLVHHTTRSVYLAASHHLPPAFKQHPERLSGWCYCIEKYLADDIDSATNISEITCTRLKDLEEGTAGLRYHASIPLFSGNEKIGIMNVVSTHSQQLTDAQLQLLYTIGELLSIAVQRAQRYEESYAQGAAEERRRLTGRLKDMLLPEIDRLILKMEAAQIAALSPDTSEVLQETAEFAHRIRTQLQQMTDALSGLHTAPLSTAPPLRYPGPALSPREQEVLQELQSGLTNKQIADRLFVSERTIKFHVSAILQKLGAANRTEAVQLALQRGILQV